MEKCQSIMQPHECEECDANLGPTEHAYYMVNIRDSGSLTMCRRCYQNTTWESWWKLELVDSAGEALVQDHPDNSREAIVEKNFLTAYDKVFAGGYENDSNRRRFYYRELPKVPLDIVPAMLELLKDLFKSLTPIDPPIARSLFQDSIERKLRALGLTELCSWSPLVMLSIDWPLLKTPKDCAVLYIVLEDVNKQISKGGIIPSRLILWNLLRKPTVEEMVALDTELQHIIAARQAERLRCEVEKYTAGHDVELFNKTFVDLLLKNPQHLHRLLKVGYFHGNMHSCRECTTQNGECPDCYSRDTEFDMTNDDTLGKVWQQTVEALGGKKSVPIEDNSDGEDDEE